MSGGYDMTTMQWRPRMIALTQVPRADIDNGEPTRLYIQPEWIVAISRKALVFNGADGERISDPVCGTVVSLSSGQTEFVMEPPQEVARLRDRAYGHAERQAAGVRSVT